MNTTLFDSTKSAAYSLWEQMKTEKAIDLWYCIEDIACFCEANDILSVDSIKDIIKKGKESFEYIFFVRNISYRIYIYSKNYDQATNWYCTETLINDVAWITHIINIANEFRTHNGNNSQLGSIKLEPVRKYYTIE